MKGYTTNLITVAFIMLTATVCIILGGIGMYHSYKLGISQGQNRPAILEDSIQFANRVILEQKANIALMFENIAEEFALVDMDLKDYDTLATMTYFEALNTFKFYCKEWEFYPDEQEYQDWLEGNGLDIKSFIKKHVYAEGLKYRLWNARLRKTLVNDIKISKNEYGVHTHTWEEIIELIDYYFESFGMMATEKEWVDNYADTHDNPFTTTTE